MNITGGEKINEKTHEKIHEKIQNKKKTRKLRRRYGNVAWKEWHINQPGYHEKTVMMKKCGKKCFLGPNKTFPICKRNTCKMDKGGVYAAFIRAREYMTLRSKDPKYKRITAKAKRIINKYKDCEKLYR